MHGKRQGVAMPRSAFLDFIRSAIRVRHYSRQTEKAYVYWTRQFILFHGKRHPNELDGEAVEAFLTFLAVKRKVAPSTQNQALCALLFVYREVIGQELPWMDNVIRARRQRHIPTVLSRAEEQPV
jgi:site-specific recombinase XerD